MAKHEIYFELPERTIMNSDAQFHVYSDELLLGSLKISKGTIEWRPTGHTYGYHTSWERFDEIMKKEGQQ